MRYLVNGKDIAQLRAREQECLQAFDQLLGLISSALNVFKRGNLNG